LLSAVSFVNITGGSIRGFMYPMGLSWHWKAFMKLLGRQLCGSGAPVVKMETFQEIRFKRPEEVTE
jgi:hypothetical protein